MAKRKDAAFLTSVRNQVEYHDMSALGSLKGSDSAGYTTENKKHLKNVGPYCEPFYIVIHQGSLLPPLSHAACASMSTMTPTTTTTRDRGDRYGPMEWVKKTHKNWSISRKKAWECRMYWTRPKTNLIAEEPIELGQQCTWVLIQVLYISANIQQCNKPRSLNRQSSVLLSTCTRV